ncbi:S8 family peptidase [Stigmatella aurantiaca]|uniref:Peptidase S8 and S53 n=1 Tax=Stigmatella aurantiaca (strain DW4/3-1) TaxID=378806 RepID=E3FFH2_STIAD|nr:S8 family peptidase [Stigmatella aurantiaca]ADO72729.1 Peptidase S8 and S53 [Stigmatella aurantiaca DW4/3-1]
MRAMRQVVFIGSALALSACGGNEMDGQELAGLGQTEAPLQMAPLGKGIPEQYIVVMKKGAALQATLASASIAPMHTYQVINGFAASLTKEQLDAVRRDPAVAFVEQDQVVHADVTQRGATWGLDRIDQRALPLSTTYAYGQPAFGVSAYIIDTGVTPTHPDFNGRAASVFNSTGDGNPNDCNGHGTHVAGTIGGTTWGVAKGVFLYGVKVLGCSGSGSYAGVIAGVDWVRTNGTKPAVANMSLGGGFSQAVNDAVNSLANSGIFVAVAAGNSNADACNYSPASAAAATTAAASESNDARAYYSNFGPCIDVYAPGSGITSAWLNGGTNTISGTSMASPHIAGVAALYKGNFGDDSSANIDQWIKSNATPNVITGNPAGTPNLLLYKGAL